MLTSTSTKQFLLIPLMFLAAACSSNSSGSSSSSADSSSDATSNASQAAMSSAGSQSSAGEATSTPGFLGPDGANALATDVNDVENYVDAQDKLHPLATSCTWSGVRSTCSAGARTIHWNSCTIDRGLATMTGGWNETYSDSGCSMTTNGNTLTRTTPTGGSVLTTILGATITTDTNGGTTYSNLAVPSTGTLITTNAGGRTLDIHGLHRVRVSATSKTVFDHFITTDTLASTVGAATPGTLTVTGTIAAGNRTISSGTVTVYHELAKYTAAATFNNVVWGSSSCCYPTSGSITATLTGAVTGNTTLQFSTTCGSASYTDTTGTVTSLTLDQCN